MGFPSGSAGKESTRNVGDLGSIPGLGRSSGQGKSYPYSGLEKSMNCTVYGVTKSRTWLRDFHFHFLTYFQKKKKCSFRESFCKSQGLVTICSKKQNTTFSNMDFFILLMRLISPLAPKSFYHEKEEFEILSLKSTYSLVYKNKTGANTQNNLR